MSIDKTQTSQEAGNLKQLNIINDCSLLNNINLGVRNLKQLNIVVDFDSPLLFLLFIEDMLDLEKLEWQLKNDLFCFKSKLYILPGVLR